jgi:hypothetical protein
MSETATVTSIDTATTSTSSPAGRTDAGSQENLSASFITRSVHDGEKYLVLRPNELYPFSDVNDAVLFQALEMLKDCVRVLELAQRIDPLADYIGFDEEMMEARAILRNLFDLRSIGDGFGSVINAILWSLKNKDTETLNRKQLSTVLESLKELKRKPLMHFDTAMSVIDQLEEADLVVEPTMLDELIDLT